MSATVSNRARACQARLCCALLADQRYPAWTVQRSTERILTTHTGSLPRPREILDLVEGRDQREVRANPDADRQIEQAVNTVVHRQVQLGIDVPTDGEMGRVGFSSYATERLTGFDGERAADAGQVETHLFPEFYADMATGPCPRRAVPGVQRPDHLARARVHPARHRHLQGRAAGTSRRPRRSCPAVSPGQIWLNFQNEYYPSDEAFVFAAADALATSTAPSSRPDSCSQLDDPGLAMGWNRGRVRR